MGSGMSVIHRHHNVKTCANRDYADNDHGDQRTAKCPCGPRNRCPAEPCSTLGLLHRVEVLSVVVPAIINRDHPLLDPTTSHSAWARRTLAYTAME